MYKKNSHFIVRACECACVRARVSWRLSLSWCTQYSCATRRGQHYEILLSSLLLTPSSLSLSIFRPYPLSYPLLACCDGIEAFFELCKGHF